MNIRFIAALGASAVLAGCVSVPPLKEAPVGAVSSRMSSVATRMPTGAEKYAATDLEGTYFGASGAKGSAAVGVMFGVIGVLGNIAHINAQNRDSAEPLTALTSMNLGDALKAQVETAEDAAGYELLPSAQLHFKDKQTYVMSCAITAKQRNGAWQARYSVPIEGERRSDAAADAESAKTAVGACLKDAHALFAGHVDGGIGSFEPRTVTLPRFDGKGTVDQVMQVHAASLPDRVVVQDFLGLSQLRKDMVVAIK